MVGILVVTHGRLAEGFMDSAEMIMGKQEQLASIGLFPDTDLENFGELVNSGIKQVDTGDGTLVFVDMFGASPCNFVASNIADYLAQGKKIRVVTGVNLSMLIESLSMRTFVENLDELYQKTLTTGKEGIRELLDSLSNQDDDD